MTSHFFIDERIFTTLNIPRYSKKLSELEIGIEQLIAGNKLLKPEGAN